MISDRTPIEDHSIFPREKGNRAVVSANMSNMKRVVCELTPEESDFVQFADGFSWPTVTKTLVGKTEIVSGHCGGVFGSLIWYRGQWTFDRIRR